jgi:tRNA (guanine-N(7)-)-methyltransferase subunit TRM82
MPKRLASLSFSSDGTAFIVGDRVGDVYCFAIQKPLQDSLSPTPPAVIKTVVSEDATPILGHFSTITDVAVRQGLIASSDRDNRVRVSKFPKTCDIQSFCLGHTAFVTRLAWIDDKRLVSGGGDGFLRLWQADTGVELAALHLGNCIENHVDRAVGSPDVVIALSVNPENPDMLVAILYGRPDVFVVTGLSSDILRCERRFTVDEAKDSDAGQLTGVAFDNRQYIWISSSSSPSIFAYRMESNNSESRKFVMVETIAPTDCRGLAHPRTEKSCQITGDWLVGLRKKKIVEGWKGKKRRRVETEDDDAGGSCDEN